MNRKHLTRVAPDFSFGFDKSGHVQLRPNFQPDLPDANAAYIQLITDKTNADVGL